MELCRSTHMLNSHQPRYSLSLLNEYLQSTMNLVRRESLFGHSEGIEKSDIYQMLIFWEVGTKREGEARKINLNHTLVNLTIVRNFVF